MHYFFMFDRLVFMLENLTPQFCDQTIQPPIQSGYPHQQYQQTPGYPAGTGYPAGPMAPLSNTFNQGQPYQLSQVIF